MQWNKINLQHQQGLWGLQEGQTLKTPKQSILYLQQFVLKPSILSITECPGVLFWFSGLLVSRNFTQRAEKLMCLILKLRTFYVYMIWNVGWFPSLSENNGSILTGYCLNWPGTWYSVISQQQNEKQNEGDSHSVRSQMSSDRARISRAVPGRGLTIKTLPDNMTRRVVSVARTLWHLLFVLAGLPTCHLAPLMSADETLWAPCLYLARRTLANITHGVALAQKTPAPRSYGWTWLIYGALMWGSMAFCQIHTSRLW